ncbi:MAG TPA: hypothetical protein VIG24_18055 [Acidimicrobiia bacterium]
MKEARERIAALESHSRRLRGSRHPLASLDREYALRAIHWYSAQLARMAL